MKDYLLNILNALGSILSKQELDVEVATSLDSSLQKIGLMVEQLDEKATNTDAANILDELAELFDQMSNKMSLAAEDSASVQKALEDAVKKLG